MLSFAAFLLVLWGLCLCGFVATGIGALAKRLGVI